MRAGLPTRTHSAACFKSNQLILLCTIIFGLPVLRDHNQGSCRLVAGFQVHPHSLPLAVVNGETFDDHILVFQVQDHVVVSRWHLFKEDVANLVNCCREEG